MKPFAESFYKGKAWQDCRASYIAMVGGLCEKCMVRGIYKPGVIVHHKIHLTPENINDPRIATSFDNLELVCRDCHAEEHGGKVKRFDIDPVTGKVSAK